MDKVEFGKATDGLAVAKTKVITIPYHSPKETAFWTPVWNVEKRPVDAVEWIEAKMESVMKTIPSVISNRFANKSERNVHLLKNDPLYKRVYNELRKEFEVKVGVDELVIAPGNLLVNGGMDLIWDAVIGNSITEFSNANAAIGVGDSSTAAAVGQTNLQAASNKLRKGMNATFPDQPTNPSVRFQSDFTGAEANYAWLEVATFNNTVDASGTMLHRLVPSGGLGTKSSGATWTITVTITLS